MSSATPIENTSNSNAQASFIQRLLLAAIPIILFVGSATVAIIQHNRTIYRDSVIQRNRVQLSGESRAFESYIEQVRRDAHTLAEVAESNISDAGGIDASLPSLHRHLMTWAKNRPSDTQVRFIDAEGNERVRIDRKDGELSPVPAADLQFKGDRYYFKKGIATNANVYLSKFDLNVENGQIEKPFVPTIRVAAPLKTTESERNGLIVINLNGRLLLDTRQQMQVPGESEIWLLNSDGYWLMGPTPEDEWGFMLEDRAERG